MMENVMLRYEISYRNMGNYLLHAYSTAWLMGYLLCGIDWVVQLRQSLVTIRYQSSSNPQTYPAALDSSISIRALWYWWSPTALTITAHNEISAIKRSTFGSKTFRSARSAHHNWRPNLHVRCLRDVTESCSVHICWYRCIYADVLCNDYINMANVMTYDTFCYK